MADFINRDTLVFIKSVHISTDDRANDPDHPDPPWLLVEPGSANRAVIDATEQQYRKIAGDVVSEMTQAEQDVVNAAALDASRDDTANTMDEMEEMVRAFALVVLDELNARALNWNAILDAIDNGNNLAAIKSAVAAIPDYPQRTIAQMKSGVRSKLGT